MLRGLRAADIACFSLPELLGGAELVGPAHGAAVALLAAGADLLPPDAGAPRDAAVAAVGGGLAALAAGAAAGLGELLLGGMKAGSPPDAESCMTQTRSADDAACRCQALAVVWIPQCWRACQMQGCLSAQ